MNAARDRKTQGKSTVTMGGEVSQVIEALKLASAGHIAEARLIAEALNDEADREAVEQGIRAAIQARAEEAARLAAAGKLQAARDVAASLRARDRRPIEDRIAETLRANPEQTRAAIRADQRRRKLDANRAAAHEAPQVLSDTVRSWVKLAQGELDKAAALHLSNPKKNRAKVQQHEAAAKRLLRRAEEHARDEADHRWVATAMAETQAQAELRGQSVTMGKTGPATTTENTGLEDAKAKGYLEAEHGPDRSEELYRTGVRYREAYEIARGQTTSKGDGSGGFGPKGPQLRIVEAGEDLATMQQPLTMKERRVLDCICGEGLGLFQTTIRCRMGTPAVRRALRGGLTAAMEAMQERRQQRQDSPEDITSVERVKGASEAVRRAQKGL